MYVAVVLDSKSQQILRNKFEIPSNWKIYCHHMTINLGSLNQEILGNFRLGDNIQLQVVGFAQDEKCMAVSLQTEVPSKNRIKHITVACSPMGKPKNSNDLKNWNPLIQFELSGTIEEVK